MRSVGHFMLTDAPQTSIVQQLLKLGRFLRLSVSLLNEGSSCRGTGCRISKGPHCLDHGGLLFFPPSLHIGRSRLNSLAPRTMVDAAFESIVTGSPRHPCLQTNRAKQGVLRDIVSAHCLGSHPRVDIRYLRQGGQFEQSVRVRGCRLRLLHTAISG